MKNFILLLAILIAVITANAQWTQIGQDIDGEAAGDGSGSSVSLSSDGTIVAIGAFLNDGNGSYAGHVRIYEYSGANWIQIGSDIDGEAADDRSGISVSLSSDGTIVAIGAFLNDGNGSGAGHVRVFEYSGGNWIQIGNDIDGEAVSDYLGNEVSMNSDGSIVAIGAMYNDGNGSDAGHVRIYEYSGGNWVQIGSDIDGETAGDRSGWAVSLSSTGNIVAIGACLNDGNGGTGHVRVYEYSAGSWLQKGNDIDGEANGDYFGRSVSLSSDGLIVAIGAHYNDGNSGNISDDKGHVRIYEYNGGNWVQMGSDIDGETSGDWSGCSVSLNSTGNIVVIGAPINYGYGGTIDSLKGHVRIYEYSGGNWMQIGNDIDGEASGDYSGNSVSLNSDGSTVAIGAPCNSGNGTEAGHVRVYNFTTGINEYIKNTKVSIYPNPTSGKIRVQAEGIIGIEVMDLQGCKVKSQKSNIKSEKGTLNLSKCEIDLSQQPKGIYIIKVTTEKGVAVEKIIKN